MPRRRSNWQKKLARRIGRFGSLADVRDFILAEYPDGPPRVWHHIGELALAAADNGDTSEVETALKIMDAHHALSDRHTRRR